MTALFDTLEFARRMGAGGFTEEQAQTASSALSDVLRADLATKTDLEALRLQLDAKITETRLQLDAKITETRLTLEAKISEATLALEAKISEATQALEGKMSDRMLMLELKISETRLAVADAKWETIRWTIGIVGLQFIALIGSLFALIKLFVR